MFVERSPASLKVLRRNLHALAVEDRARVVRGDVRGALPRLARDGERFELVLADPPYAASDIAGPLAMLAACGLLAVDATVVVERSRRHPLPRIEGLVWRESRHYGRTRLDWLGPGDPGPAHETSGGGRGQGSRERGRGAT